MNLFQKAALCNLLGIVAMSAALYVADREGQSIEDEFDIAVGQTLPMVDALQDMRSGILQIVSSTNERLFIEMVALQTEGNVIVTGSLGAEKPQIKDGRSKFDSAFRRFSDAVMKFFPYHIDDKDELRVRAETLYAALDSIPRTKQDWSHYVDLLEAKEKLERAEVSILSSIEAVIEHESKELAKKRADIHTAIERGRTLITAFIGLALLVTLITSLLFSRSLNLRMRNIQSAAKKAEVGDYVEVTDGGSDELGILVRAFNRMMAAVHSSTQQLEHSLETEKQISEQERQFVSMACHEFRTPLTIIDSAAQRLMSRADKGRLTPEDAAHRVGKIRDAVRRMTWLMESTLTAARMEEGKIKLDIGPCDIAKLISEVCERQQEIAQSHVISCDLADLPETIQADSGSLEQILTNLLSNAVKYAPDTPDIEVKTRTQGHQIVISVRDNGIGIDQEELSRIGERFFRAKTSAGTAGTGIGLNLVKMLVEMHGGTINIESKKGEGSIFTVLLPIAGPEFSQQAKPLVA